MSRQVGQRKILVLRGQHGSSDDVLNLLKQCSEVVTADNVEQALQLLREDQFDAVFSETGDFLPLERAAVSQQAVAILNNLGEGVCMVSHDGTILWANRQMTRFGDAVKEGVSQCSRQGYEFFQHSLKDNPKTDPAELPLRRYSFTHPDSRRYFEMIITPMLDEQNQLTQVATVVWEETANRRSQQRIDAIDKAGSELVRLEAEAIRDRTVEQRITLVQDKIVRYAKDLLNFDHFVVRILNRKTNELEVLFGVSLPGDEGMEVFANSHNNGITGYVAATGRSYICNDLHADPHYKRGLEGALCSLTVPLRLHDKVIGTLNVESNKPAAFGEDDRQMAEIFGRYIAISLNILNLLVEERYQTTGQAADYLTQQLNEPLSTILTEASLLMEEYIGHDDVRRRLQRVIDNVVKVKNAIKDTHAGTKGILGARVPVKKQAEDDILAGKHILVVDDEKFIRETIVDVVQEYDCIADMAHDGREAIALVSRQQYDLVISDIKLPGASGYDIFAAARQAHQATPVILMTGFGYDPNHSIVRANREGLSTVLYKPFKVDQLLTEIRRALTNDD